jgi:hypothetical protein
MALSWKKLLKRGPEGRKVVWSTRRGLLCYHSLGHCWVGLVLPASSQTYAQMLSMSFSVIDPFSTNLGHRCYSYSTVQRLLHGRKVFWQLEQYHTKFGQASSLYCCEATGKNVCATAPEVKELTTHGGVNYYCFPGINNQGCPTICVDAKPAWFAIGHDDSGSKLHADQVLLLVAVLVRIPRATAVLATVPHHDLDHGIRLHCRSRRTNYILSHRARKAACLASWRSIL